MSKQIIISVLSIDRPGIIAEVTNAIYSLDGNLADLSQSVLRGYFNMIVIARFSTEITTDAIKDKIASMNSENLLNVIVKDTNEAITGKTIPLPEDIYVVTGQGEDRTGLVASISTFCRDNKINIIDYDTKLGEDIYSMMLEIDLTNAEPAELIHEKLDEMAGTMGLSIIMQNKKLFDTINEITLT